MTVYVRSHIGWGGERSILYKSVETSPSQTHFKNLEGKPERESPKRTISANGGLGLLQLVSEPDTGRCASKEAKPQRGSEHEAVCQQRRWASKEGGLGGPTSIGEGNECQRGRWTPKGVDCEIPHRLGRRTKYPL